MDELDNLAQTYSQFGENSMNSIFLTASVFLFAISPGIPAADSMSNNVQTQNPLCSESNQVNANIGLTNPLVAQQPVIIDPPKNGWESQCTYYTMRDKDGKVYECKKCTYGGPYCWRKY